MFEGNPERGDLPDSTGSSEPSYEDYLGLAYQSVDAGRTAQACMLFMTAYETVVQTEGGVDGLENGHPAVSGLRHAWDLACQLEDRNLAETVYRRLSTHLSAAQSRECNARLQGFALQKLKEIGVGKKVSQSLYDLSLGNQQREKRSLSDIDLGSLSSLANEEPVAEPESDEEVLTYDDLVGFEVSVMEMRQRGFGLAGNEEFESFVSMLNERHGIDGLPSFETLLFRAPAREDASRLMFATAGELGNPIIRMRMDSNAQGAAVLCIMASPELRSRQRTASFLETGEQVSVILEDIDYWGMPFEEARDDSEGPSSVRLSRGAMKAMALIRAAVESPDVTVLASASSLSAIDDDVFDLLAPISSVVIDDPTYAERSRLWTSLVREHQSMARLDVVELVDVSAGLSRFDIVMCTREAVEQAYRESIRQRTYVRVTKENIYDKIAACQPLDSREYRRLEDALVDDFRADLDKFDGPDGINAGGKR